jgi:hypothetical protein
LSGSVLEKCRRVCQAPNLEIKIPEQMLPRDLTVPSILNETLVEAYDKGLDSLKDVTIGMFKTDAAIGCKQLLVP